MTYIYIDESGDLGKKGSKYFLLSAVKIDSYETLKKLSRIPKKIRSIKLKKKLKESPELKFSNTNASIRKKFLNKLNDLDVSIYCVIIEKRNFKLELQNNLPTLYEYLTKILLEPLIKDCSIDDSVLICLDRCLNETERNNFEDYVKGMFFTQFADFPSVEIVHEDSQANSGLQVIDFVSGAFGFKYNTTDFSKEYVNIIQKKIRLERIFF